MKRLSIPLFLFPFLLFACATAPKAPPAPAPETAPAVAAPLVVPDSISGTVVSDDPLSVLPPHTKVRLRFGSEEIGTETADASGKFRFEGPLAKGRYELSCRTGALHGSRAFTFNGGELKGMNVVIAKSEPRRHRRRRH